ncbi:MAG: sigma-70 family RNA polymerase sigma factor [Ignavibacteriaceae bacterium]|jgi:RNA polymerase sigma-70 factor (ECF subfamily)
MLKNDNNGEKVKHTNELLPHLFRLEYSKMTAVICRHFGLKYIEIAEDIVSDTFLKATETWSIDGIPNNPTAWLYTVAKNKAKDFLKHQTIADSKIGVIVQSNNLEEKKEIDFEIKTISDSQLAMIFAVCNPLNSKEAQISLALQILCGFSVEEIADAFLVKSETIKKRLLRARKTLRNDNFQIQELNEKQIKLRLDIVSRTIYLLFNEGYYSKSSNYIIRKDLCLEAIRLALILAENPLTNTTQTNALLALMCYQSSRFEARENEFGEVVLFEQQNKYLWNQELIDKGNYFLINAFSGSEISKYHLEAAIAYWHTTPTDEHKWKHILQLYNQLILIEYSPITALNRTFVFANVYGKEEALKEAEKINLKGNHYYYMLLGFLYSDTNLDKSIYYYNVAAKLSKSKSEKNILRKEINRLKKMNK